MNHMTSSAAHSTFTVTRSENPVSDEQIAQILENPGFGRYSTDHMVAIDWTEDEGWHNARVEPYKKIRALEFLSEVPKSATGKILRRTLRDRG